MQTIFENCHNKSLIDGLENFKLLLASTDPEILIATLETLSALVKLNPPSCMEGQLLAAPARGREVDMNRSEANLKEGNLYYVIPIDNASMVFGLLQARREYTRGSPSELLHMQVGGGFERRIWSMKSSFMPP
ncbi:uncharacterized protein LOC133865808 [Alnus glutinosa]|uniref:uncharacterized protein LOC133865808 n=1 Tax=Alnus glutinosa TaxID=3517 RepID=UPI002D7823C5|nr:uncharacterized protein LOC133865808 [Alnus glutinosa]XP_062158270.1 uncharacterized protein LOC133865808 [Alnus glutinosa]XP_062158272.1 uncharacterized protein LOC133865808 [Alnus glutinosa]XP_062158273.1 uncharacterized protein LOC133865808 [Alnus glutinosa]